MIVCSRSTVLKYRSMEYYVLVLLQKDCTVVLPVITVLEYDLYNYYTVLLSVLNRFEL